MSEHIFSTGKFYIAEYGAGLASGMVSGNLVGDIQDATFDGAFTEKTTYTDAATSRFATAIAYHEGKVSLKITTRDFNPLIWTAAMNVTGSTETNTGYTTYQIGAGTKPVTFAAFFQMQDTNDNDAGILWIPSATIGGPSTSFKLTDFGDTSLTINGILDVGGTNAAYILCQPTGTPA